PLGGLGLLPVPIIGLLGATLGQWAAQPGPLQLDARPNPGRHLAGEIRRRIVDLGIAQRPAAADAHLHRTDTPATPDLLGSGDRYRHDGRAALQRQSPDAA